MAGRKKRQRGNGEVELNLAAMLDMAFQLLTFFILTFKPAPVEADIALRLPPPQPATSPDTDQGRRGPGEDRNRTSYDPLLHTLVISVAPDKAGNVGTLAVGDDVVSVAQLDGRLRAIFGNRELEFDQVIVQAGPRLRYEALMKIIDTCSRQTLASGANLKKLSFLELSDGSP